jgi:hypothetical protein
MGIRITIPNANFSVNGMDITDDESIASITSLVIEGNSSVSGTGTYRCKATYDDGTKGYVSALWASSNTSVATVDSSATSTATVSAVIGESGTIILTATYKGMSVTKSLSVASTIVFKNYITTSGTDGINICQLQKLSTYKLNNLSVECVVKHIALDSSENHILFSAPTGYTRAILHSDGNVKANIALTTVLEQAASAGSEYTIIINTKTGIASINGVTSSDAVESSSSSRSAFIILAGSGTNDVPSYSLREFAKMKSFKWTNPTTNEVLCDLVPALNNGEPCMYDKISNTILTSVNNLLVVSDD